MAKNIENARRVETISNDEFRYVVPSYYRNSNANKIINDMINKHIINNPSRTLVKKTKVFRMNLPIIDRCMEDNVNISVCTYVDHMYVTYIDELYGRCVAELRIGYDHMLYTPNGVKFNGVIVAMHHRISQEYEIERIPTKNRYTPVTE